MNLVFRSILPHIGTGISVAGILCAGGLWAFNTYAEDLIDQRVGARISELESVVRDMRNADTIQTLKLENIQRGLNDARDAQRDTQRDIKDILKELRK